MVKNSNMPPRKKPAKPAAKPKNEAEVDSDKTEAVEKLALDEDLEDEEDDDYDPEVNGHLSITCELSFFFFTLYF